MTVDHPARLAAGIAAVVLFALLYSALQRRQTARALAYSSVPFFVEAVKPRRWIPGALQALWIAALGGVVLAFCGPHLTLPVPVRDGNIFICIDTSGSMSSTDVFPTRAQAAKAAARAFIAESPSGTRIGIISFAGAAGVVTPLSPDHQAVIASLDEVPSPNGATAIGDALKVWQISDPSGYNQAESAFNNAFGSASASGAG